MKRSEINAAVAEARAAFERHGWHLPPAPRWDVTGFGLGRFAELGLVLVNLTELPQYCEKLMYARAGQRTPMHCHKKKQEDIIARAGTLAIQLAGRADNWTISRTAPPGRVLINGEPREPTPGEIIFLESGSRVTLYPGTYHEFWPVGGYCVIGEVSTANDDRGDNFFENPDIGRYEAIDEDEPTLVRLLSE